MSSGELPVAAVGNGPAQPVVVVGGGAVGLRKAAWLLKAGARVTVVAPRWHPDLERYVDRGEITHLATEFSPAHLQGAVLAEIDQVEDRDRVRRPIGNVGKLTVTKWDVGEVNPAAGKRKDDQAEENAGPQAQQDVPEAGWAKGAVL